MQDSDSEPPALDSRLPVKVALRDPNGGLAPLGCHGGQYQNISCYIEINGSLYQLSQFVPPKQPQGSGQHQSQHWTTLLGYN